MGAANPSPGAVAPLGDRPEASTLTWLGGLAASLGVSDPRHGALAVALHEALSDPPDAAAVTANALAPGGPPIEVSFADREPGALRFVWEPGPRSSSAAARRSRAAALARTLNLPALPLERGGGHYGAVVGAVCTSAGIGGFRIYSERLPDELPPPPLQALEGAAQGAVSGLAPLFWSQDLRPGGPQLRTYLLATAGLSFLELGRLLHAVGAGPQSARLAHALRPFADGAGGFLPGWAVIGLRPTPDGVEVKVDRLRDATAPHDALWAELDAALHARSGAAWARFRDALRPQGWAGGLGAVGLTARPTGPLPLTAYWRPRWTGLGGT